MKKFCAFLIFVTIIFSSYVFITDYYGNPYIYMLAKQQIEDYVGKKYSIILKYENITYDKSTDRYVGTAVGTDGAQYKFYYFSEQNFIFDGYYNDTVKIMKMTLRNDCKYVIKANCMLSGKVEEIAVERINVDRFLYNLGDLPGNSMNASVKIVLSGNYENKEAFCNDVFKITDVLSDGVQSLSNVKIISTGNNERYIFEYENKECPYNFDSTLLLCKVEQINIE